MSKDLARVKVAGADQLVDESIAETHSQMGEATSTSVEKMIKEAKGFVPLTKPKQP